MPQILLIQASDLPQSSTRIHFGGSHRLTLLIDNLHGNRSYIKDAEVEIDDDFDDAERLERDNDPNADADEDDDELEDEDESDEEAYAEVDELQSSDPGAFSLYGFLCATPGRV